LKLVEVIQPLTKRETSCMLSNSFGLVKLVWVGGELRVDFNRVSAAFPASQWCIAIISRSLSCSCVQKPWIASYRSVRGSSVQDSKEKTFSLFLVGVGSPVSIVFYSYWLSSS